MRYSKLLSVLLVFGISVLLVSASASASQVVFQDGFESQPADRVGHTELPDGDLDARPVSPAPVGRWNLEGFYYAGWAEVTDGSSPGAYEGSNCLRRERYGSNTRCDAIQAAIGLPGQSMHFEAYVNIDRLDVMQALMLWGGGSFNIQTNLARHNRDGRRENCLTAGLGRRTQAPTTASNRSRAIGGLVHFSARRRVFWDQ